MSKDCLFSNIRKALLTGGAALLFLYSGTAIAQPSDDEESMVQETVVTESTVDEENSAGEARADENAGTEPDKTSKQEMGPAVESTDTVKEESPEEAEEPAIEEKADSGEEDIVAEDAIDEGDLSEDENLPVEDELEETEKSPETPPKEESRNKRWWGRPY